MIKIRPGRDYVVALESVAMTDIVMTIFIFFFISFSLLYTFNPEKISKIDVKLPGASSAVSLEGSEKIIIAITEKGEYFINDEPVSRSDIKDTLGRKMKEDPGLAVLLKVDKNARFDNVASALDIINELHIEKVSVATEK